MKNLIFDLDGTLGDSLPLCIAAFQEAVIPFTNSTLSEEEVTKHFGISEEGIISKLLPDNPEEGLANFLTCYKRLLDKNPSPFCGVKELLDTLSAKGIFITMVTGKSMHTAKITLEKYGLSDYFSDIYAGSPTGEVKDDCINELITKHQLDRSKTVYIGDAVSDIVASKNCNIRVIAAAWASTADIHSLTVANPDYLFSQFSDFSEFLHNHLEL